MERNGESKLEQKLPTLASRDNGIKTYVVVVAVVVVVLSLRVIFSPNQVLKPILPAASVFRQPYT